MQRKPLCVAAFCLLCLVLPALPLAAQDGYITLGDDSDGIWSLYLPSVEEREDYSGSYIVGWVRLDYSDIGAEEYARNGIEPHHSMDFWAANTRARQIQLISETFYDEYGRQIYSNRGSFSSSDWRECIPGTMGEAVWNALMRVAGYR